MPNVLSQTDPLTVMISSRCTDLVPFNGKQQPMGVLRVAMKKRLEAIQLGGRQVYSVWIHEDESNGSAARANWDVCIDKATQADVLIVLYNGRAGWLGSTSSRDGVGICHAELSAAFDKAPAKVRAIELRPLIEAKPGSPDAAFQAYMGRLNIPAAQVDDGEDALTRVDELAAAVVLSLAREGVGIGAANAYYAGEALEWSRMNFERRRDAMVNATVRLIRQREIDLGDQPDDRVAAIQIKDRKIGFVCDGVPASMSTPAARELVGQPFLKDHELTRDWPSNLHGPVHVIACQKNITEAQAVRLLGFPDVIVVSHPFGVYVADDVQKIQMAFIANCRDETTTRSRVQAFLNWLSDHGEMTYLVQRAVGRRQISDFVRSMSTPSATSRPPSLAPKGSRARRSAVRDSTGKG